MRAIGVRERASKCPHPLPLSRSRERGDNVCRLRPYSEHGGRQLEKSHFADQNSLLRRVVLVATLLALSMHAGEHAVRSDDFSGMRGANYVPSYARNDVQTWMDYDPAVIDRELGYAERLRLNTVRVFLQVAVYERDPKLFLARFEDFLALCEKHHLR